MKRISQSRVPRSFDEMRIDSYLAHRFTYLSRSQWQEEIQKGKIFYNGDAIVKADKKIRAGDVVEYSGASTEEPEVDRDYSIIYEDDHLIAVNKPGNLPVHPSGIFFNNTLLMLLQEERNMKLHPLHRLDRETSGVVVFSKSAEVASAVQKNFQKHGKSYIAIVHGRVPEREFCVDAPIGPDTGSAIRNKVACYEGARFRSLTHFRRLLVFRDFTLLKAMPVTGRQHQIRVHLKYRGYPILGDKIYGLDETFYRRFKSSGFSQDINLETEFPRSALHSRSLKFFHPVLKKTLLFKTSIPVSFQEFIERSGDHV